MTATTKPKRQEALEAKIKEICNSTAGERDIYPLIRDLLTQNQFGINLIAPQIQVDTSIGKSSGSPDLCIYSTVEGKAVKNPEHLVAVFEAKTGNVLNSQATAIFNEKKKYVQSGTRYLFLLDQTQVLRYHVEYEVDVEPVIFPWDELNEYVKFQECFGVISRKELSFEAELKKFQDGTTRYAYRNIDEFGRNKFIDTIKLVSEKLRAAIEAVIKERVVADIKSAYELIEDMEKKWGERDIDWKKKDGFPIVFSIIYPKDDGPIVTAAELDNYTLEHDAFRLEIEDYMYAFKFEDDTLQKYAERAGLAEKVSFLKNDKQSRRAVEAFIYETASLILSRMLMIRFSEDHSLMIRYISNGGIAVFTKYSEYFKLGYQILLRQTYEKARALYHGLFDRNILDWILHDEDKPFSAALVESMYLLSRWDFKTVRGDILSGVYDHYLEESKRRQLGEVFTRPEIARYILERCEFGPNKTVLDPACGSGTFLIEALEMELSRFKKSGMLNTETIKKTLQKLNGMDINQFSIALSQIQVLWHLLDLFVQASPEKVRKAARDIMPGMNLLGGYDSLDPMGQSISAKNGSQMGLGLNSEKNNGEKRALVNVVDPKFRQINGKKYDLVVGNPPYVRAHRRQVSQNIKDAYDDVIHGQFDLYLLFLYRALKVWLKPGGRMGFIVPLAVLDSGYSGKLREVLSDYRVVEIVDLELLRKKTFHGIKRPVIILIVENSKGSDTDLVEIVTAGMDCYEAETDYINLAKAVRTTLPFKNLFQTEYLPKQMGKWANLLDFSRGRETQWTTKISEPDLPVLEKLSRTGRLGEIVQTAWTRRQPNEKTTISLEEPKEEITKWQENLLIGEGLKLGGSQALSQHGLPVFKGQNIFPGGVLGLPMGLCDLEASMVQAQNLYLYASLFDYNNLFAVREIAQVPTAVKIPKSSLFQNTAYLVQLKREFPLNYYVLSRVIQYYSVIVLRASVIEDLASHWYKKQIGLLPIPDMIDEAWIKKLVDKGEALVQVDRDIADKYRHLDALLEQSKMRSLQDRFLAGEEMAGGIDISTIPDEPVPLRGLCLSGELILGDDLLLRIKIPNLELRSFVYYSLLRRLDENPSVNFSKSEITSMQIPDALGEVNKECEALIKEDSRENFEAALRELDYLVGHSLGLTHAECNYIIKAMGTDPFLREIRPMYEHRGLRVQPYSDHSGEDRYN